MNGGAGADTLDFSLCSSALYISSNGGTGNLVAFADTVFGAEAQRQRMTTPDTRDTQPAGIGTQDGAPVASGARMAQDFTARSRSPRDPELPRDEGAPVETGPRQSYRYTERDPNAEFPGAERGTGPEGGRGRTPFPDDAEVLPPGGAPAARRRGPVIDGEAEDITLRNAVAQLRRAGVPEDEIRRMSPAERRQRVLGSEEARRLPAPEDETRAADSSAKPPRAMALESIARAAPAETVAALRRMWTEAERQGPRPKDPLPIAPVSDAEAERLNRLLADAGVRVDVRGFTHTVDPDAARHAFKAHGSGETEAARGQVALTAEDWARIPEILRAPDAVQVVGTTKRGVPLIGYWKRYNGHHVYVEQTLTGKGRLAAVTMYKQRGPIPRRIMEGEAPGARMAPKESPQGRTSETPPARRM